MGLGTHGTNGFFHERQWRANVTAFNNRVPLTDLYQSYIRRKRSRRFTICAFAALDHFWRPSPAPLSAAALSRRRLTTTSWTCCNWCSPSSTAAAIRGRSYWAWFWKTHHGPTGAFRGACYPAPEAAAAGARLDDLQRAKAAGSPLYISSRRPWHRNLWMAIFRVVHMLCGHVYW